jgi:hypothetical protein
VLVSYGVPDARGRVVGCVIAVTHAPAWSGDSRVGPLPERYLVTPHATREGNAWGAAPTRSYASCPTYAQARAYAEAYVGRARARAWRGAVRLAAERGGREDGHVRASQA